MYIEYNEQEKLIKIKDNQKLHFFGAIILLTIIVISSILNILHFTENQSEILAALWALTGILSLIVIIYHSLRKSISKNINVHDIDRLIQKKVFGQIRLTIKLKNGKTRNLRTPNSESQTLEIIKLFDKIGITIKQK